MNSKFTNFLILILVLLISNQAQAQKCSMNSIRNQNIQENPLILDEIERINTFTEKWIKENKNNMTQRAVVTVPVVVHVLWRENQENISDAQIMSQIEVLNNDFRKMNANFSSTPMAFQALAADVEIEFCLAQLDPTNNPSSGITRTQTNTNEIGNTKAYFITASGGKDAWDINKYLNFWVCDLGEEGLLGFATPPGVAQPIESDGVVIDHRYFGTIGTAANSAPNHLGRTATHEVGHYFNLEHIWGPGEGGCYEDDFVGDTPSQDYESEGCPNFPSFDYCTETGNGIMFNNYLDYSADECMTMFTLGQKMRMLAALNGPRASLLDSPACSGDATSNQNLTREQIDIQVYPNPVNEWMQIELTKNYSEVSDLRLFNIKGQQVMNIELNGAQNSINVSKLPNGIYYLTSQNNSIIIEKIIINK